MARAKNPSVKSCGNTHPWCRVCRPDVAEAQRKLKPARKEHTRPCRNCGRCDTCLGRTAPEGMKACRACRQTLPLELFPRRTDTGGYRNQCRACRNKTVPYARCTQCNVYTHAYGDSTRCHKCRSADKTTKLCAHCGTPFVGTVQLRKYCSKNCQDNARTKLLKDTRRKIRDDILRAYGGDRPQCVCCGEGTYYFLAIDHIDGGGHKQRKELGSGGFYTWIRKNNYPPGLRILCHNCNYGRQLNGGICPHEDQ